VREPIDRSVQLERVHHGNIPVEPSALAHHKGDLPRSRTLPWRRCAGTSLISMRRPHSYMHKQRALRWSGLSRPAWP
jgi:hypothetical protein